MCCFSVFKCFLILYFNLLRLHGIYCTVQSCEPLMLEVTALTVEGYLSAAITTVRYGCITALFELMQMSSLAMESGRVFDHAGSGCRSSGDRFATRASGDRLDSDVVALGACAPTFGVD